MKTIGPIEENLKAIMDRCKGEVSITINEHTASYHSVLDELMSQEVEGEIDGTIKTVMERTDAMIRIQAYPDTPIGFYHVYHYDLAEALETMRGILEDEA